MSSSHPDSGAPGHAPLEIEVKLRPASLEDALARIERAGFAVSRPRTFESNLLLDSANESLRSAGTMLRLREFGGESMLTFKGASQDSERYKVREEIETSIGSAAILQTIFGRLGYLPAFRYEKYRTTYSRTGEPGLLTLDETPIGPFLELEGAPHWIDRVAAELGFPPETYITDSYGRLWLRHCQEQGIPVTDFVFATSFPCNG